MSRRRNTVGTVNGRLLTDEWTTECRATTTSAVRARADDGRLVARVEGYSRSDYQ